jgi:hypothetical protein
MEEALKRSVSLQASSCISKWFHIIQYKILDGQAQMESIAGQTENAIKFIEQNI